MSKNALRWTEEELAAVMASRTRPLNVPNPIVAFSTPNPGRNDRFRQMATGAQAAKYSQIPIADQTTVKQKRRGDPEHQQQKAFIEQLEKLAKNDRRYKVAVARTFAIPNGSKRSKGTGGKLKAEGVRPGVPDLFVAYPVNDYCGLFLEMKSLTGDPSREQREWLNESFDLGYAAACCRGAREAMIVWRAYVDASL